MLFLLPALLLSVSAGGADPGDGIRVATEGTLRLSAGADVRVAGNLEADGKLLVRGRLEVGGDLRLSSARFEEGSELTLTGGRAHRLDVPDDLALWNVTWSGRPAGELRPVAGARGGRGPAFRDREGDASLASPAGCAGVSVEQGSRVSGAITSSHITIIDRIRTSETIEAPRDRGPPTL